MNRKQNFARSVAATALLCLTIVPGLVAAPAGAVEEFKGFCCADLGRRPVPHGRTDRCGLRTAGSVLGYPQYDLLDLWWLKKDGR